MKRLNLIQVEHKIKIGDKCKYIEPNICEDSIFYLDNNVVGFYIQSVGGKLKQYLEIANKEFLEDNVPKQEMQRPKMLGYDAVTGRAIVDRSCKQFSTILGAIPPKPHMKRPYPSISSVHQIKTANIFIKAMLLACKEAEIIVKKIMPEQYQTQQDIFKEVEDKWKFGSMYTSSISNFNISAPYHRDNGNFQNTVNIILTKRLNSKGGCLNVPDYGVTFEQADNSMLVYPAWMNVHGVTPIKTTHEGGYRNSFIFYPLKAFKNLL